MTDAETDRGGASRPPLRLGELLDRKMTTAQDIANACWQFAGHQPIGEEEIEGRLKIWRQSWQGFQEVLTKAADCIDRLQAELDEAHETIERLSEERKQGCPVGPFRRWLRKLPWTQ